ncbi:hypothetical protein QYF36_006211 [Acer negundo]|nr:hypothetical protein QYF36_006211 [Acer negundo]
MDANRDSFGNEDSLHVYSRRRRLIVQYGFRCPSPPSPSPSLSKFFCIESSSSEEPSPLPFTMTEGGLRIGINGNYISCSSYEDVESPPCPLVHFTVTEGGNENGCFECNYCGQLIDCVSENDGSCVFWDHLGNDSEEYKNRVVDEKQNILSFETNECDSSCGSSSSFEKEKESIIGIYGDAEVENFTRGIKELLFHVFDVYNALDTSHGVQSSDDDQPLNGMDIGYNLQLTMNESDWIAGDWYHVLLSFLLGCSCSCSGLRGFVF